MALRSESERRAAPVGHLYVLTRSDAPDVVKVGRDADPARHAGELQTGHCFHVNVAAVFPRAGEHVSAVQAALQRYRVTPGAGWFRCSVGEALATIADVMAETGGCTEVGAEAGGGSEAGESDGTVTEGQNEWRAFVQGFVDKHVTPVTSMTEAMSTENVLNTISRRAKVSPAFVADVMEEDGWEETRRGSRTAVSFYRMRDGRGLFARARSCSPRRE